MRPPNGNGIPVPPTQTPRLITTTVAYLRLVLALGLHSGIIIRRRAVPELEGPPAGVDYDERRCITILPVANHADQNYAPCYALSVPGQKDNN